MKKLRVILLQLCLSIPIIIGAYAMEEDREVTLNKKVGNLIITGFKGTSPEEEGVKKIHTLLQQEELGGVILYGYNIVNPEQLFNLTKSLHEANLKSFIAVDQEGGFVQRLTEQKGFRKTPSAADVAQLYADPEEARSLYNLMAEELKRYYININFAPVVDLNNPENPSPAIGKYKRSYGDDPELVSQYAKVFIEEHLKHGILSSPKHFPGHGYSTGDTHQDITDTTQRAIPEKELVPYKTLMKSNHLDMVMTAHIVNRREEYDPEGYPATLSPKILKNLLRSQGYNGVVISDDLHMGAIQKHYSINQVVPLALNATCDMLLFSNNRAAMPEATGYSPDLDVSGKVIKIVEQEIKQGGVSLDRINESYQRVSLLKARLSK
ncbi:glycoside hydrolase family 3 protein [Candidatus Paracaedibacter symbiosus]|uniref:glycoside hydrolase family 3 protein n=1 Tax=Candidatus Paracaedibacter symbiosus TaxID=244582 RepID=UPI000509C212|nr:glycoside hydrolase family 3 protein [Candidatus Paracaedibacter symbiosus]